MKRTSMRILALSLVLLTIFSCMAPAFAETITKFEFQSSRTGYSWKTFYVNTTDKKTAKLSFSDCGGYFMLANGSSKIIRGYWEIEIDGRNSTSESWKDVKKYNIKNKSTDTIEMKGYTQYRIKVYAWKTTTIGSYRGGSYNHSGARWADLGAPKCTIKAKSSNIKNLAIIN